MCQKETRRYFSSLFKSKLTSVIKLFSRSSLRCTSDTEADGFQVVVLEKIKISKFVQKVFSPCIQILVLGAPENLTLVCLCDTQWPKYPVKDLNVIVSLYHFLISLILDTIPSYISLYLILNSLGNQSGFSYATLCLLIDDSMLLPGG